MDILTGTNVLRGVIQILKFYCGFIQLIRINKSSSMPDFLLYPIYINKCLISVKLYTLMLLYWITHKIKFTLKCSWLTELSLHWRFYCVLHPPLQSLKKKDFFLQNVSSYKLALKMIMIFPQILSPKIWMFQDNKSLCGQSKMVKWKIAGVVIWLLFLSKLINLLWCHENINGFSTSIS